jgi:hypothetical protein
MHRALITKNELMALLDGAKCNIYAEDLKNIFSTYMKETTPFHLAINTYNYTAFNYLLENNCADVNLLDSFNCSPLYIAVKYNLAPFVNILLGDPWVDINLGHPFVDYYTNSKDFQELEEIIANPYSLAQRYPKFHALYMTSLLCNNAMERPLPSFLLIDIFYFGRFLARI